MAGFMRSSTSWSSGRGATEAHEVGCGEGELAIRLARRGIRVRGTDAFPQVLEEARSRAAAAGVEIDFEATPVEELDPSAHAAELVVCCEVLEHLERSGAGARGARRAGPALADRERPPRAALARPQPGAALLRG